MKCKTCGVTIRVPRGWGRGPAVRKHYWAKHPERMQGEQADRRAERALPTRKKGARRARKAGSTRG
ncbi:MAG: hypothetical protein ACRDI1_11495 [Actinomycetota bacterium]